MVRKTSPLTEVHKAERVEFDNWLISKPQKFANNAIRSNEKWFVIRQHPNKQTECDWAPFDAEIEVDCKEQGGQKVICWEAVIRGQFILHWFNQKVSVNARIYLNMFENVLWPQIQEMRNIWIQQDGAPPHMPARTWLQDKFQGMVISRLTPNPWPARSPDLSCLDYWFCGVAMEEIRRIKPTTLKEQWRALLTALRKRRC